MRWLMLPIYTKAFGTILLSHRFKSHTRTGRKNMTSKTTLRTLSFCAAAFGGLALAACGYDAGDRAVSGGLIGAGAGAAIGAAAGNAGTGAVVGGLAGAAVGAATDPCQLNLGDPWWRDHGGRLEYERR